MNKFSHIENTDYLKNLPTENVFSLLQNDDEIYKQVALLNIEKISSQNDVKLILNCLTEHSSETREYCSFLINRLMKDTDNIQFFSGAEITEKFASAISDVNPKVCRNILEILPNFKEMKSLYPILIKNSFLYIEELQEKNKSKNYQYNTKSFRLYWNIYAIAYTINLDFYKLYENETIELIQKLFTFNEYTIREKAAHLAVRSFSFSESKNIEEIIKKYKEDENFFVRVAFGNNK